MNLLLYHRRKREPIALSEQEAALLLKKQLIQFTGTIPGAGTSPGTKYFFSAAPMQEIHQVRKVANDRQKRELKEAEAKAAREKKQAEAAGASRQRIPRRVTRSILRHCAMGAKRVVVVCGDRGPSRVYGYEQYQRVVERPKEVRPWDHRQERSATPDPLGGIDAGVIGPVTRESIYE